MNSRTTRRALLGAGIAVGSAAIIASQNPKGTGQFRFGDGNLAGFSRDPLRMAMLDRHARRLEPLLPQLEQAIRRTVAIEGLSFKELYDNFTIDLLQQTGRYDVVSMCDAWIPYFGRSGYFNDVPMPDDVGGPRIYPPVIAGAALGIESTQLVAYPWTFDFVCSAFGDTFAKTSSSKTWIGFARAIATQPSMRLVIPALSPTDSSESFRAMALSFGQDIIDPITHEPGLDRYGSQRGVQFLTTMAIQAGVESALGTSWDRTEEAARNGEIDHAPLIRASGLAPLLQSQFWSPGLLPVGREGRFRTAGQVWMLAVPAGAPSLDDARATVQWFTSHAVQEQIWPATGLLPATRHAINSVPVSGETRMRSLMFAALDSIQPVPKLRSFQLVMGIAGDAVPPILRDPTNVEEYLQIANEAAMQRLVEEDELVGD